MYLDLSPLLSPGEAQSPAQGSQDKGAVGMLKWVQHRAMETIKGLEHPSSKERLRPGVI